MNARPMALGGAFFAVEDDIASVNYNPSTISLYSIKRKSKLTVFVNPILPFAALKNHEDFDYNENISTNDVLNSFQYFIKGIVYSYKSIMFGAVFNEESLNNRNELERLFDTRNYIYNVYNTLFFNIKLAKRMSFGIKTTAYSRRAEDGSMENRGWGGGYGIYMQPGKNYSLGLTYIDFPADYIDARKEIERICDETLNAGISYSFRNQTNLYVDIRNLNEDELKIKREMHFGLESNYLKHISFRCGYFHCQPTELKHKGDIFSFGIGLLDYNLLCSQENRLTHNNYLLNYSVVFEKYYGMDNRIGHFLSFYIRI